MSSKVLRGGDGGAAEAVTWPAAGRGAAGHPSAPASSRGPGAPRPGPPPAPDPAEEAARQLAAARAETVRQVEQARQAGYREGETAARRAAEAELRPVVERLTRSVEEVAHLRPALAAQAEASLLKLAVAIARRILHRELSLDPDALAGIVRAALEKVQLDEVCRVRAHPAEAAALGAAFGKAWAGRGIQVEADASLERGAVIVETGRGKLDASVETQLAEIERGLADRLRRRA